MPGPTPPVLEDETLIRNIPHPSDPPTLEDIVRAAVFSKDMQNCYGRKEVSLDDTTAALKYQHPLLHAADAPDAILEDTLWRVLPQVLAPILQDVKDSITQVKDDITHVQGSLTCVEEKVTTMNDDITVMKKDLARVRYISALTHNALCSSGDQAFLEVVMFPDGVDPTCAPHNLPPLTSPGAIRNLSVLHRDAYFHGYYPGVQGQVNAATKIPKIFLAVGVQMQD